MCSLHKSRNASNHYLEWRIAITVANGQVLFDNFLAFIPEGNHTKGRRSTKQDEESHVDKTGIYISIPFCRQKCTYCNFASEVHPSTLVPRYLSALQREISDAAKAWRTSRTPAGQNQFVDTIYMGGGTPGMLGPEQLSHLLDTIRESFVVDHDAEITIEASPETETSSNPQAWP